MKKIISIFIFCLALSSVHSQDLHWSQPANALLYLNPAFAGIDGLYSAGINYRNQWSVAGKPYRTSMAAGDVRLNSNGWAQFGIGAVLSRDASGDGRYNTISAGLALSCLIKAGDKNSFGAGMGFNYVQNSLTSDVYSWGSQFDGDNYNSGLPSGETQAAASHRIFDLTAGVSYKFDATQGSPYTNKGKWIVGYSIGHLTQPNISFVGYDQLLMKHTGFVKGIIPMGEKFSLVPMGLFLMQGSAREITGGALLRRTIGQVSKVTGNRKGAAVSVGLLYRSKTTFIPTLEIEKGVSVFTISYDINAFGFATASKRGGLEFSLRLRSIKAPAAATRHHGRPKKHGKWF